MNLLKLLFGTKNQRDIKRLTPGALSPTRRDSSPHREGERTREPHNPPQPYNAQLARCLLKGPFKNQQKSFIHPLF